MLVLGVGHHWGFICFSIGKDYVDLDIPSFVCVLVTYCRSVLGSCFPSPVGPGLWAPPSTVRAMGAKNCESETHGRLVGPVLSYFKSSILKAPIR